MRNNCSKIRIVALLMVMLLTTVNTWAQEKVNMARTMFHKWDGVGADASCITTNAAGTVYEASGASWDMTPRQGRAK